MTEGIIKVVKGTRTDTETCFHVGHGNAFPCRDVYFVSYALKNSMQSMDMETLSREELWNCATPFPLSLLLLLDTIGAKGVAQLHNSCPPITN